MVFSRARALAAHTLPPVLLAGVVGLLGWLLPRPGFFATKLLLLLAALWLAWAGWQRTQRGARLVARFILSLEHRDLQQSFRLTAAGPGLEELGQVLDRTVQRLRAERASGQSERRFAAALADEAPTPLLLLAPDGTVHLANKAARRLFQESDGRRLDAFARYGDGFAEALAAATPGRRLDARVRWNGLDQRAVLAGAVAERDGEPWRIVSVNIIQRELDAAELATQADLVRVLTHEIMNSLTPVTSLAASAAELVGQAVAGDPAALADAQLAIDALARRAGGITRFVDSYREFGRSPTVTLARFAVRPWLDELVRSFRATPAGANVQLAVSLEPDSLHLEADAVLLGQVVFNLLKNAAEAAAAHAAEPQVSLHIRPDEAGRHRIGVADNGPGVPAALRDEIFLPFFTTKRSGTGVGLSFARQVVLLHGGVIGLGTAGPGASFEIVL